MINISIARKVLEVVDAGLITGVGEPVPGQMCVEAAVCYALGLPHGDDPACVSRVLRSLKIRLNDSQWSSSDARAKGLRRLAVAQLGSRDVLDDREFVKRVATLTIRLSVPVALRAAASVHENPKHQEALREAANKCEREPTPESAREARLVAQEAQKATADTTADTYAAAAYATTTDANASAAYASAYASADARDKLLADFAEGVVQILIEMNAPGCEWLPLTEIAS